MLKTAYSTNISFGLLFRSCILLLALPAFLSENGYTQQSADEPTLHHSEKGDILTGLSGSWTLSERKNFNIDFERGIQRYIIDLDAVYFITSQIAIGPEISYNYLYRDMEDPFETGERASNDVWQWNVSYGGQLGWFLPVKNIINSRSLQHSTLFIKGGVNWLRLQSKTEWQGKAVPETRFGYKISTGLLIPLGNRIVLETNLSYLARKRDYVMRLFDSDIITLDETVWPSNISLGIGLKFRL